MPALPLPVAGRTPRVALLDVSFLQNGKSGLLLTNRALYSSTLKRPVLLNTIVSVDAETIDSNGIPTPGGESHALIGSLTPADSSSSSRLRATARPR